MTREEAIRILDPETTREAMAEIEYYGGFIGRAAVVQAILDACVLAVAALREQEERENPKPLTLDELKLMDGEPVWLLPDRKCFIVNNDFQLPYGERHPCGVDMWGAGTGLSLLARCGVYRSKPKEE